MLNFLVITSQADSRKRAEGLLPEASCKVTFKPDAASAVSLVERGVFDVVLLMLPTASEHTLDEVRTLRRARKELALAVILGPAPLPWEESALVAGADIILREPVSFAHISSALRCVLVPAENPESLTPPPAPAGAPLAGRGSLEILRDFSHILGYSLDHKLFAEHFVQKVREIVGVSRIAVFLEQPPPELVDEQKRSRLSCAAAIGVPSEIIECFELSRSAGIGARMFRNPQILLASGGPGHALTPADQKIQREFEILGCMVAIPISDRTRTIGVAALGAHVTGRSFTSDELQLLFLLMEELGSAIKNTWLHRQVTASHRLLADVLAALSSGCLVVDRELNVLHANRAMLSFIKGAPAPEARLEFAELPQKLAGPLYEAVVRAAKTTPFFFTSTQDPAQLCRVSIIPFHSTASALPQSAMLVLEDFTQIEAAKRFEIEASKAKLIALIAKRFAHEIRNSLVPLATHEQLLDSEYQNDDFRRSLKTALSRETNRIQRFTEQMLYLAQPPRTPMETVSLREMMESCFQKVSQWLAPAAKIRIRSEAELPMIRCHRPALEHALQEVIANALQASPEDPGITLRIDPDADGVRMTVRDNGSGFSEETALQAMEPFFTTRNTGVGLGLTVARKIIEDHHGHIRIAPRNASNDFDVEICLPAAGAL